MDVFFIFAGIVGAVAFGLVIAGVYGVEVDMRRQRALLASKRASDFTLDEIMSLGMTVSLEFQDKLLYERQGFK